MKVLTTGTEAFLEFIHLLSKYCLKDNLQKYKSSEYGKLKDVNIPSGMSVSYVIPEEWHLNGETTIPFKKTTNC